VGANIKRYNNKICVVQLAMAEGRLPAMIDLFNLKS